VDLLLNGENEIVEELDEVFEGFIDLVGVLEVDDVFEIKLEEVYDGEEVGVFESAGDAVCVFVIKGVRL